ncbi:MAG: proton-conducting transporter membrane subunit, partial [Mariprofundaceae bacterium]|nr:proton-conducting transporter membrane subunit [Mariprofundaceae bacterium]
MNWFVLLLGAPLVAAVWLAFDSHPYRSAWVNKIAAVLSFIASLGLALQVLRHGRLMVWDDWFFMDAFNVFLVALTAFVATTTAIFSGPYMRHELEQGKIDGKRLRLYHAMYQMFVFGMFLGQTSNNLAIIWLSLEIATLATVLLVSLYRTPGSIAAAWKYLIICGVGISLALFGTATLFFASSDVLGHGEAALTWTRLYASADHLDPTVMRLAFVVLMVGYG